jgi:putative Holliday junction resolvase
LCLDPGTRKVGVAVSDEIQFTVRPLETIRRKGWKKFLEKISELIADFDAKALVIGLPLSFEGGESDMSEEARRLARNFSLSLKIPVFLHDERLSTYTARGHLWKLGKDKEEMAARLDAEAAAVILSDFIETRNSVLNRKNKV